MSDPTASRQAIAFASPLVRGKTNIDRRAMRSCWQATVGPHTGVAQRLDITREAVWTSNHPMAISALSISTPTT
ncbi:MAG TPA: hypothetical protein VFX42_00890 [Gemmatimonadales bacterium]|nr:hypothetical protein [Gemmatimonadales bacterium]